MSAVGFFYIQKITLKLAYFDIFTSNFDIFTSIFEFFFVYNLYTITSIFHIFYIKLHTFLIHINYIHFTILQISVDKERVPTLTYVHHTFHNLFFNKIFFKYYKNFKLINYYKDLDIF